MKIKRKIAAAVLPGAGKSVFRKKSVRENEGEKKAGGERENCSPTALEPAVQIPPKPALCVATERKSFAMDC